MNNPTFFKHHGLVGIKFFDSNHIECSVQESSVATEARLWLGREIETVDACGGRMHLTVNDVRDLIRVLQSFVEHGNLRNAQGVVSVR